MLYFSFGTVWGGASCTLISSLYKLQKRAVRIIKSAPFRAHTEPIFLELKLLPIAKVYLFSIIMYMFQFEEQMLPSIFDDFFIQNIDIHQYSTRQSKKLHVPYVKLVACNKNDKIHWCLYLEFYV